MDAPLSTMDTLVGYLRSYNPLDVAEESARGRVSEWAAQFEDEQGAIDFVAENFTFVSKETIVNFFIEKLAELAVDVNGCTLLNWQGEGKSQADLVQALNDTIEYPFSINQLEMETWIYIDDISYTGNTLKKNLTGRWPRGARREARPKRLLVLVYKHYGESKQWIETSLRHFVGSETEVQVISDGSLDLIYDTNKDYSCFVQVATRIALGGNCKPLGLDCSRLPGADDERKEKGFGAMVVTYRNCPNNCPVALWWSVDSFVPLFPRK